MADQDETPPHWRRNFSLRMRQSGIERLRREAERRGIKPAAAARMAIDVGLGVLEKQDVKPAEEDRV